MARTGVARAIRQEAHVSLREVAQAVEGVDRTTILRWETGQRAPRGEAAIRYLRVLEELTGR
jgi:DNA-binding transcriptional regulator YiaG